MAEFSYTFPHLPTSGPYPLPPAMALIHHEGRRGAVPGGEGGRRVRHAQPAVGEGAAVGFALEQTFVRQAGLAGCWFGEYFFGFLCLLEDSFEGVLGILRFCFGGFQGGWNRLKWICHRAGRKIILGWGPGLDIQGLYPKFWIGWRHGLSR